MTINPGPVAAAFLALSLATVTQSVAQKRHMLEPSPETVVWGYYGSQAKPVLRVASGDIVAIRTLMTAAPRQLEEAGVPAGQVEPELRAIYEKVRDRGPGGHILTGPIYVEGAEPGDVLEVRILSMDLVVPYAFNAFYPGNGFLPEDFAEYRIRILPVDMKRKVARFGDRVEIPLRPFFGSMGVAPPPAAGRWNSAPPWIHAGNLDNKELVAGTTLWIPVHVPGALFQAGDGHAAQGNGEVSLTAVETSLKGELQLTVRKGKTLQWPRAETPTHVIAMGTHEDLTEATRIAVREMIDYLASERGLSREDAYMLASMTVDLSITQLVDGKKGVHAMLPKSVFVAR